MIHQMSDVGPDRPGLPAQTGLGLRVPGPPVQEQPVLHGGEGGGVLCGRSRGGLQHQGAQPEVLPGSQ